MIGKKKNQLLAGIDVGTTKICTVVAQAMDEGLRILGTGTTPAAGLRKGIVVNLSETIESVRSSVEQAEKDSQTVVQSAYVSVGGAYIRGINQRAATELKGRKVGNEDIERVVGAAREMDLPDHYQVIHVLTQDFNLDGQGGIENPLGMFGHQLAVKLHVVVNASAVVQNIVNAVNQAGILVDGVVMQQLASAESILSKDEKDLGAFLVDIGGGTTDIAVYRQGSLWHSEVLPMGGSLITKDLAIGLKAPIEEAEELKKEVGSVFPESVPGEEKVEISEVGTGRARTIPRRRLCQIIQARCDEILEEVAKITSQAGFNSDLATGMVLTGGGALLDGMPDRAERILGIPVRLGYPLQVVGHDSPSCQPEFSTALGLLRYAHQLRDRALQDFRRESRRKSTRDWWAAWILEKIGYAARAET